MSDPRARIGDVLHQWLGGDRDYYDAPAAAVLDVIGAPLAATESLAMAEREAKLRQIYPGERGERAVALLHELMQERGWRLGKAFNFVLVEMLDDEDGDA